MLAACSSEKQGPAPQLALAPQVQPTRPAPIVVEEEGLSENQIKSVVEAEYTRVRGCHTIEFSGQSATGGRIVVDLEVAANGAVSQASISDSTFDSRGLEECVVEVTRALKFPKSDATTEFSWVFKFRDS